MLENLFVPVYLIYRNAIMRRWELEAVTSLDWMMVMCDDVEKLKKLILHNPYILTLPEVGDVKDDIIPKNVQQFYISCCSNDKLVHILALLKLELVQKRVLIFTNSIDMSFRLILFFEQFGIKAAVLNAELPQNSRLHILEKVEHIDGRSHKEHKKSKKHPKQKLDSEFGVVRGIDFKNVHTVINFEMPKTTASYVHRIRRTGRAYNTSASDIREHNYKKMRIGSSYLFRLDDGYVVSVDNIFIWLS